MYKYIHLYVYIFEYIYSLNLLRRYKFVLHTNVNLNLYCAMPRNPSFSIWWILGMLHFQWKLSYRDKCKALAKSTKSRNPDSSVHVGMKPKTQFEFVLRHTKESEFLDLADCHTVINSDKCLSMRALKM